MRVEKFDVAGAAGRPIRGDIRHSADASRANPAPAGVDNTFARERYDLDVVIDTARSRGWIGDGIGSLGLFGFSRGGGVAILRAASDTPPKIGALVTWSSIAHIDRWTVRFLRANLPVRESSS